MNPVEIIIPKQRIGVVIGKKGETKTKIQKLTKTIIEVDSQTGEVKITPINNADAMNTLTAKNVILAIARGFTPEKALKLLDEENTLEIIDLEEYSGRSKNSLVRLRGRIIGKNGKAREKIEKYTSTFISVYGKTVSIIGPYLNVLDAKRAIQLLLNGAPHNSVYSFLERRQRARKEKNLKV